MKRIKIAGAVFLSCVILGSAVVYGENIVKTIQVTYRQISIFVNGKQVSSEPEPFIYQGRTFVPLRTVGEAVNKSVEWDNAKNQVKITDKPKDSFSFPLHKLGEKVEVYPFVITINKAETMTLMNKKDWFFINISLEYLLDEKLYWDMNAFSLFDEQGNRLKYLNNPVPGPLDKSWEGSIGNYYDEIIENKHLFLVFSPFNEKYSALETDNSKINNFLVFDLGLTKSPK